MNDKEIFKHGSTTYYWSSFLFPKKVKKDVFKLYSFVRVVDDYVDLPEPDRKNFDTITTLWQAYAANQQRPDTPNELHGRIVNNIIDVCETYECDQSWVDAFLASMQMDIDKKRYRTLQDTIDYMYGSAEVIGLLMAQILGLPEEARPAAQMQGRAMQYINFIRDIAEDNTLGRCYFPADMLSQYGLPDVTAETARQNPDAFKAFMRTQIAKHTEWQQQANQGLHYIPWRLRIAVMTARNMYRWTGKKINDNPLIIYERKVKPPAYKVLAEGIKVALLRG